MAGRQHNKYNILYTTSFGTMRGGGQWSLYYLIKHLNKDMYHPIVLCPEAGELTKKMRSVGADTVSFNVGRVRYLNPAVINRIIGIIRTRDIDLIHTDSSTETFYFGIAAKVMRLPLIWHIRVSEKEWFLDRLLSMFCARLILVANAIRPRFKWLENTQKVTVVYNGIDLEEFDNVPATSSIRKEYNVKKDTILLGCIGRIERRKGQEHLISTMRQIHNARLILVGTGEGEYVQRLQGLSENLKVSDRVIFAGYRDNIPTLLKEIDILVFPTISGEGFTRVILEAMAAGKTVVATDNAGNPEAVVDGTTGYIVPAGSDSALVVRINELVANSKKRGEMGKAGRERVEEFFTVQRYVEGVQDVYRDVFKSTREHITAD